MVDESFRGAINVRTSGPMAVAELRGALGNSSWDSVKAPLESLISNHAINVVVLDMREVSLVASFALAAIGFFAKDMRDRGGVLSVVAGSEQCLKPFRLAGLIGFITFYKSLEEALTAAKQ